MFFVGLIAVLAVIDLCIKKVVEEQEDTEFPRELRGTGGKILLYKNHNPGFPFGFLKEKAEIVRMIPLALISFLGGMLAWMMTKKGNMIEKLSLSLVIGGAISNLYDRLARGYVVDYFSFQFGRLKKVVFNLGDMFIFLGAMILLIWSLVGSVKER